MKMINNNPVGVMSFDIDGTLTADPKSIPDPVIACLEAYAGIGWSILIITGRPFCWAQRSLQGLSCPYYLAVINGANIIYMPEGREIYNSDIRRDDIKNLEHIGQRFSSDLVVYGGYRRQDLCYWRPTKFSEERRSFLIDRYTHLGEVWVALSADEPFPLDSCASVKFFGNGAFCKEIAEQVSQAMDLQTPVIRDPFAVDAHVLQITSTGCNKGAALKHCLPFIGISKPIIAAGDDYNDISMLDMADIAIVMETAPEPLLKMANIIAPAASCNGIIQGLQWAVQQLAL